MKCVQLDYTMACPQAMRYITAVRNHWYYSVVRWRAVKHDHAMQVTWLNLKVGHTPRPQRTLKQASIYRDPAHKQRLARELEEHLTRTEHMDMVKQLLRLNEQAEEGVHVSPDLAMYAASAVYPALLASLKEADTRVQDDIRSRKTASPSDEDTSGPDCPVVRDRRGYAQRPGCEWGMSARSCRILLNMDKARAKAPNGRLPGRMRRHYLRLLKKSTCNDGDTWVSEHLEPLKRLTGPESTQAFHKVWNNLVRRGRPTAAGSGRYFDATAMTPLEEAEGWAEYHEQLRTWTKPVQWDPLPSTKGRSPIPAHIVNKVVDNIKEDKATGVDDTSITLWKSTELGRQALVAHKRRTRGP
jgi:hypothetical protein